MNNFIEIISKHFNKTNGELVYSGTLALEVALKLGNLKKGSLVGIPSIGCYKIALAILRVNAIPVFINPNSNLLLDSKIISRVCGKYDLSALIVVHYLGLPADVKKIKNNIINKDILLIEDACQAWLAEYEDKKIGGVGDITITSFGKNKPLSFGIGGGVFSNKTLNIAKVVDDNINMIINNEYLPLPYKLNPNILKDSIFVLEKSEKLINQRRLVECRIRELIQTKDFFRNKVSCFQLKSKDKPTWHRIPLFFSTQEILDCFSVIFDKHHIKYQHPLPRIPDMFVFKHYNFKQFLEDEIPYYLLLYPIEENFEKLNTLCQK